MGRNVILIDWIPKKTWEFQNLLSRYTGIEWETMGVCANHRRRGRFHKLMTVYMKYFLFPAKILIRKDSFDNVIAWQQFFGIVLAFYLRLLRLKKHPSLNILTFIYKAKKGILGKLYYKFIKYSIHAEAVKKIICFSEYERDYYLDLFDLSPEKVSYSIYGISDTPKLEKYRTSNEADYLLSVGRSNRDYDFLISSLKDSEHSVKILCDELECEEIGSIEVINDAFDDEYLKYLSNCLAVIVPLKDENISSGQLVFLRAMEFGKPIIVTDCKSARDYITDGYNGLIINKEKDELIKAIELIKTDKEFYEGIVKNCKQTYKEKFSLDSFSQNIAKEIVLKNSFEKASLYDFQHICNERKDF